MKYTSELEATQQEAKRLAEEGVITNSEAISMILGKVVEILRALRVPEGFTTEEQFMKDRQLEAREAL